MRTLWSILIGIIIGAFAFECSRLLAMKLSFAGLSPTWSYYFVPFVTAVLLNPWYWCLHWPLCLSTIAGRFVRLGGAVVIAMLLWCFLLWETQRRVMVVEFLPGLTDSEIAQLYDKLHDKWTYDPKKGIIYISRDSTALPEIDTLWQSYRKNR